MILSQEERDALERQPRIRSCSTIEVTCVETVEGRLGCGPHRPEDAVRIVHTYFLPGGELLIRKDPCEGAPT